MSGLHFTLSPRFRKTMLRLLVGLVAPGRSGALYEARVKLSREPGEGRGARNEERDKQNPDSSLLAPRSSQLLIGARGDAKVTAERITIGKRLYRYLAQTFRLPM